MQTSVKLAEPFAYSPWFLIVTVIVIAGIVLGELWRLMWRRKKKVAPRAAAPAKPTRTVTELEQEYLARLAALEQASAGMTLRRSYQELSKILRGFVGEVTGTRVQNLTLSEIEGLKMPRLTELVAEYYSPEFAFESRGDLVAAIGKARRMIEEWK